MSTSHRMPYGQYNTQNGMQRPPQSYIASLGQQSASKNMSTLHNVGNSSQSLDSSMGTTTHAMGQMSSNQPMHNPLSAANSAMNPAAMMQRVAGFGAPIGLTMNSMNPDVLSKTGQIQSETSSVTNISGFNGPMGNSSNISTLPAENNDKISFGSSFNVTDFPSLPSSTSGVSSNGTVDGVLSHGASLSTNNTSGWGNFMPPQASIGRSYVAASSERSGSGTMHPEQFPSVSDGDNSQQNKNTPDLANFNNQSTSRHGQIFPESLSQPDSVDKSSSSKSYEDEARKYGLLGLLEVIQASNNDKSILNRGVDLTSLGLSLNSQPPLHPTFSNPWADRPKTREPQYTLPECYRAPHPALKTGHFQKFSFETLIYIFYAMPRDVLQAHSAQELYRRGWKFHRELRLWFKYDPEAAKTAAKVVLETAQHQQQRPQHEAFLAAARAAEWLFFDTSSWEKRVYLGDTARIAKLAESLVPETEIQVVPIVRASVSSSSQASTSNPVTATTAL